MLKSWQLQEAKSKFSQLVEEAMTSGPQVVTRHGVESVVVMSVKEYKKIRHNSDTLVEFFKKAPAVDLEINRDKHTIRDVEL